MVTLPACSVASSSRMGATKRQGPHHGAQKSTMTGTSLISTSVSNVESVVSLVAPTAGVLPVECSADECWRVKVQANLDLRRLRTHADRVGELRGCASIGRGHA